MSEEEVEIQELWIEDETAIPTEEAVELKSILIDALADYKKSGKTPKEWSKDYFKAQMPEKSEEEIEQMANEIDETLVKIEEKRESVKEAQKKGVRTDEWFAQDVIAHMSSKQAGEYTNSLDIGVKNMNSEWERTLLTKAGSINKNPHLDGFIAEQHHVNTFNANAVASNSPYRAEVVRPGPNGYGKNSVDIVIKDANGKIVRKYQSKYCADSSSTEAAIGDRYHFQQKVIPEGQSIKQKHTHAIEHEGVKSEPLSKAGAKQKQHDVQGKQELPQESYDAFNTKILLKEMSKDVAMAGIIGATMSAGIEVGSKIVHGEKVEAEDVIRAAVEGGGEAAAKTVAACAIKVAIEKNILKCATPLKNTPLGTIVAVVDMAISNVKTIMKVGAGELTVEEGICEIEANTVAAVSALAGAIGGAQVGATIGALLGPVGAAIGGFIGGTVGGIAASYLGRKISDGYSKVRKKVWEGIKSASEKLKEGAGNFVKGLGKIFFAVT